MTRLDRIKVNSFKGARGERIVRDTRVAAAVRVYNSAELKIGYVEDIFLTVGGYPGQNQMKVQIQFDDSAKPSIMTNLYNITKIGD